MPNSPTIDQFTAFQSAYDYFNQNLFGGRLKPCLLNFRGKSNRNLGLFWPNKWDSPDGKTHEISLNPELLDRPLRDIFGTLVHEMCHQWQQDFGRPPGNGYHDQQWGRQMTYVGLIPSNTGKPGGKKTGRQMTHFVAKGGRFIRFLKVMPSTISLPWRSSKVLQESGRKRRGKNRYVCKGCGVSVTGRLNLLIVCGLCNKRMVNDAKDNAEGQEGRVS